MFWMMALYLATEKRGGVSTPATNREKLSAIVTLMGDRPKSGLRSWLWGRITKRLSKALLEQRMLEDLGVVLIING